VAVESSMASEIPALYQWLGGGEVLTTLIARFYEKVPSDPVLEPLFRNRAR
jgi:truncated hemoglobin YjbI